MDKQKKRRLFIRFVLALFVIVVGISYAYYINHTGAGSLTNVGVRANTIDKLSFNNGSELHLNANQTNFTSGGSNIEESTTSSATLIANNNTNSASETYHVRLNIISNGYIYTTLNKTPEIILTITNPNGNIITSVDGLNYVTSGGVSGFDITTKTGLITIYENYPITSTNTTTGITQNWTFKLTYVNLPTNQGLNGGKNLNANILLHKNNVENLSAMILSANGGATAIEAKGTPDFSKVAVSQAYYNTLTESYSPDSPMQSKAVVENGMYATQDDYGTSYYFRGAVDNNWVKFANMYWRIIRINGDGSVRMIYTGTTAPTRAQKVVMTGTGTQITVSGTNTFAFNSSYNNNMYVGYMYTSGEVHGLGTPSTIKGVIDSWYEANLSSYTNSLADNLFCNDRSAYTDILGTSGGGTGTTITYYGAYIRNLINYQPILTCPNQSDAFTVTDTTKGNGALDYPIGLITADEIAMAGGVFATYNTNFYLYTNQSFWSFSPHWNNYGYAFEFLLSSSGYLGDNFVADTYGGRAVVSLKSDILTTGSGTWDDPYIVF